ncbi:MAG: cytochrome c biogenesis heme-transporting ATPase CcmA [Pseudomonadales bacterium]|nr:cytochrome c biogenesis heme-transporting ATPase CcmA [Pseudomonadales bacterium]
MPEVLLRAENLLFEYDDLLLFEQLNFSAQQGEVVYVEGPNGSGKTTLLKILCGLIEPTEGQIYWRDQRISSAHIDYRQNLLYQGHQAGIKSSLSARENLKWLLSLKGLRPGLDKIDEALALSGLMGFEDVPCGHLSAGQKRRVGLARIFISNEKIWILDEPFTAIDKKGVATLESTINQHAEQGGLVFITTHQSLNLTVPSQCITLD